MIATWKTLLFRIHGILQNQSAALPCNYIQVGLSCQAVESLDVPGTQTLAEPDVFVHRPVINFNWRPIEWY